MLRDIKVVLKPKTAVYTFADVNGHLAKQLYNAALYRVRQIFTGWNKERWSVNEREVFLELAILQEAYPHIAIKRVLSYKALEKLMRVTKNPDFFSGLPMQTSQQVLREVIRVFRAWLSALKDYKRHPEKYLGRPKMPKYLKTPYHTFVVTNQDATLSDVPCGALLKLPGLTGDKRLFLRGLKADTDLREIKFTSFYDRIMMHVIVDDHASATACTDMPHMAGIDFGEDNIAAIACTDGTAVIYKGGALLSENQFFAKRRAKATGIITKGHHCHHTDSAFLNRLSRHHVNFTDDMLHKLSKDIIGFCLSHHVGTLVLGVNKGWKQRIHIGKQNNQSFVSIPFYRLRQMISYKASRVGIVVILQEESYTSQADITASDFIPVYGKDKGSFTFSGRRIKRGLYRTHSGMLINADINGAANILRKAMPDAWKTHENYDFMCTPDVRDFNYLNSKKCA